MGGNRNDNSEKHDLDAVRKALIFEQSIQKEKSVIRGQSQFQINPLIKDRKGNSKNLSGVLAEKPNRRDLEKYGQKSQQRATQPGAAVPGPDLPNLPEEEKSYEDQQVERLRALPMDRGGLPTTTAQEVGWFLGVAMRMKQGRRPKSAWSTVSGDPADPEGASTARSGTAWSVFSQGGAGPGAKTSGGLMTPKAPWSSAGSACGAPADGSEATVSSARNTPYDFSRPNTSGGLERYWRPKSRSDVVLFADNFSQKTGTHPYLKTLAPAS